MSRVHQVFDLRGTLRRALAAGIAAACCVIGLGPGAAHAQAAVDEASLIRQGEYLARAGDCVACHTAAGGKAFAGGLAIASPLGAIWSTNITPSKTHGIGAYSEAQFGAALREGKRADGASLYPAMPYTSFAKLTDADVHALYTYFMKAVPAVDTPVPHTDLPFPFSIRAALIPWNLMFVDKHSFTPDSQKSVEWNRGAYLVQGLAHCSTCHTPRNLAMAEETSHDLAGGTVGGWYAPNITSDVESGIGGWSEQDIVAYLKTGVAPGKAQAAGPMAEAVNHSFQHLTQPDLEAMAFYLKTVPAVHDPAAARSPGAAGGLIEDQDAVRQEPWPADPDRLSGAQLYDAHCASCHQANGQGSEDGALPPLLHNTVFRAGSANNVVMAMLQGVSHPESDARAPEGIDMPAFGKRLSDTQIATLTRYLTKQFGGQEVDVTPQDVAQLRAGGPVSPLASNARWMIAALVVAAVMLGVLLIARCKRRRR
ncbi:c-type cytochrome [Caballeronia insecticola]|uniref:Gluconate 2-dehydrogenase n=1 Tax=Caballeronia insecticola TaxID=758793 RepID=R4WXQ6_9BURK|nr:cytochrome c [Caballeronia insecticola]BAN23871.1 gluconate 2-dehydrogenase [Caballeronia insecticola]